MKRAANSSASTSSSSSTPARKRIARQGGENSFSVDSIPPHHYSLGEGNYAVVSEFKDSVSVHLRRFRIDDNGRIFPTKDGVSFSPFVWQSLCQEMVISTLPSEAGKPMVVRDSLFLSKAQIDNSPHISIQRYLTKEDFTRYFLPSICLLTEVEWNKLHSLAQRISESCKAVMFGAFIKKKILSEVSIRSPQSPKQMNLSDSEMVLSMSLTETLSEHLNQCINTVFECDGCIENQANQLGHDCVTMDYNSRYCRYGDLAFLSMDIALVVKDFIDKNAQILNYINEPFLNKLSFDMLLKNAAQMYIASDHMADRRL